MTTETLLIYVQHSSPRAEYIFSTLLQAIGVHAYKFTSDKEHFIFNTGARINYSDKRITSEECWVKPATLLYEKDIHRQEIKCFDWIGIKAFFETKEGDIPFDLFAASFYLLTRYEEYLPHTLDIYGRYAHENSLAFNEGFLNLPVINHWLKKFEHILREKFPNLPANPFQFHFLPTYDIDIAWSYFNKGLIRNTGGFLKSLFTGDWSGTKERARVLINRKGDPYDCYHWLFNLHKNHHLKPLYFFLVAGCRGKFDKNISPSNWALQKLIRTHNAKYQVGIHPSWQSGNKDNLLKKEIDTLKRLTGKVINKSRQHYIRMQLPDTYRKLIHAGITEDYSMGYGSINGFRSSYCLPYQWYDLQREEITPLTLYPFCYMDANSFYEQKYSAEQALHEMEHYYKKVKEVNGLLVTIWHNNFLGSAKLYNGWKEIYKSAIEMITQGNIANTTATNA